jgi:hypothetical protein
MVMTKYNTTHRSNFNRRYFTSRLTYVEPLHISPSSWGIACIPFRHLSNYNWLNSSCFHVSVSTVILSRFEMVYLRFF